MKSFLYEWDRRARAQGAALIRNFRITQQDYDAMLEAQGGVCAICGAPPDARRALAVDHDHDHCEVCNADGRSCGRGVRMLLCMRCNTDLGKYERFRLRAEAYLDQVSGLGPLWWR